MSSCTFEDGLGTGPKSGQKLRRRRTSPGPIVPHACLSYEKRCNCAKLVPRGVRFPECYQPPKEATI